MSLINDALKRVRRAQPEKIPLPLHLRPVEASATPRNAWHLPAAIALLVLAFAFLAWQALPLATGRAPGADTGDILARAKTLPQDEKAFLTEQAPPSPEGPRPSPSSPAPATAASVSPQTQPTVQAAPAANPSPVVTNIATTPYSEAYRLQGILYNPKRPSAMISGRTVFLGDFVDDWKVSAITQDTVTLQAGDRKRVLSLSK